jgi:hypothetical protein
MEKAYLHDLHAECLQPGQQPVQRGLILQRAVQHRFDRFHRGAESLEVKQGLGRKDPDDADLVVRRWQCSPPSISQWARVQVSTFPLPGRRRPMHHG